jgi:hypothetical protein
MRSTHTKQTDYELQTKLCNGTGEGMWVLFGDISSLNTYFCLVCGLGKDQGTNTVKVQFRGDWTTSSSF